MKSRDVKIKIIESIFYGMLLKTKGGHMIININPLIDFFNANLVKELDYEGLFYERIYLEQNRINAIFIYDKDNGEEKIEIKLDGDEVSYIYR
jgi:hypothetical protein